jgi:hypothetical protein
MRKRYRMFRRGNVYWAQNNETGKQESLSTKDRPTAERLLNAKNEAHQQPIINLQMEEPALRTRTKFRRCFAAVSVPFHMDGTRTGIRGRSAFSCVA